MQEPLANNNLNALGVFFHRENYQNNVFPSGSNIPTPIDLWYEKPNYGKINTKNNTCYISENYLKQVRVDEQNIIFVANFVNDAFEDFRKQFKKANNFNRLEKDSQFNNIQPTTGWQNVNTKYHSYINTLYEVFVNTFLNENNRKEKIQNFDNFINLFIEYIDSIADVYPFTKTQFIKSKFCTPQISGLILELKDENHATDLDKFNKFIKDDNFEFYLKTARKFGFLIDKNAPWRLISDLTSPITLQYMKKYKINNIDDMFNNCYYETYKIDIDIIKTYIIQFYNSIVSKEPFITSVKTSTKIKDQTIVEKIKRNPIVIDNYDYKFWNKLYCYIRVKETSLNLNQNEFNQFVQTSNLLEKTVDTKTARDYINRRFSDLDNQTKLKINLIF